MKFDIGVFFENISRKFKFHLNLKIITDIVHEDQYYASLITSRTIVFRIISISDKVTEKIKTHISEYYI